jgi:hypothetical protein
MHQNTLKNLASPEAEGDAVNKFYLDEELKKLQDKITELEALINKE